MKSLLERNKTQLSRDPSPLQREILDWLWKHSPAKDETIFKKFPNHPQWLVRVAMGKLQQNGELEFSKVGWSAAKA